MSQTWTTPAPYMQAPQPKRGTFWKATTAIVLVGALVLVVVGAIQGRFKKSNDNPTASVVDGVSGDVQTNSTSDDPNSDQDKDGLNLADEQKYGTNPNDADTDKDGFSDGEEVSNGYNPNGAGRLSIDAPTQGSSGDPASNPNQATIDASPTVEGVPLSKVFSGSGSYQCQITGGQAQKNTVTLKVLDNKVRQETPLNGSTVIMIIVDQETLYLSSFEGSKYIELNFNPATATASGSGATIRGGIFANENLILSANPSSISCQEASVALEEVELQPDQILKLQ